ncbi:hypothetical protein EDC96DRAFT_506954 [Choanephora cucurbitarum]|nr:hypothetical protein EDC96DRAFT_506954 [Choanephora cucurbitarum]
MTLYNLFGWLFASLFCSLFCSSFSFTSKKSKKKTNNEIVNVYLLFCLYISYCFKPLSSVILHQKSSSHFTSYSTQFIGQFFFVLVGKIYKKTLINITLLSY